MKQIEVQIMGNSYLLGCPEGGEAHLRESVALVDAAMCKIRDAGKVRARERIAVLAALNLAFDLTQSAPSVSTAGTAPPATTDRALHTVPHTPATDHDTTRLHHLLQRLDAALGTDGQLL